MFVAAARGGGATLRLPGPVWVLVAATQERAAGRPGPTAVGGTFAGRGGGSRRSYPPGRAALVCTIPGRETERKKAGRLPLDRT